MCAMRPFCVAQDGTLALDGCGGGGRSANAPTARATINAIVDVVVQLR